MSEDIEELKDNLKRKIKSSITCSCLFALEESFNRVGLSIQTTTKNRIIVCKVVDGKPFCESIIDDYVFIGSVDNTERELSGRAVDCIAEFVSNASSDNIVELKDTQREWQKHTSMYGKIEVVNEDVNSVSQDIII